MRYKPEQKNNKLLNTVFICILIIGSVAYSLPIYFKSKEIAITAFPFTAVAVMCFIAAIFLLIRYRMTTFEYVIRVRSDIDPDLEAAYSTESSMLNIPAKHLDLIVYKSQSSKEGAMECALSLFDLVDVFTIDRSGKGKEELNKKYRTEGFVFYDYTLTFIPETKKEFIFSDGNRYLGVILEDDNAVTDFLVKVIEKKKQQKN